MDYDPATDLRFIVMHDCAEGNGTVGTQWVEAKTFPPTATLDEVWAWRMSIRGNGSTRITLEHDE